MVKPNNEGPSYLIDDALVKIEREQGMNRRTFVKGGVALAAMLAMGGAMGTYAWFTGREVKENKTSIAENLEIEVVEPNFPESGVVENVVPGAVIPKDPSVVNKSDVLNGYLFTEIRVPIAEVLVEGEETAERLPLFSFEVNEGWKLLQEFEDGDEKVFRYGWTEVVEHGGQTGSVFDTVTFVNLKDSAQGLDVGEQLVKVIGYGIQDAEAFEGDVAKAWNAYKLQNGITDGKPTVLGTIDLTLNTNYIEVGEAFDISYLKRTNVVASSTCVDEGSITFNNVPLVADVEYSIAPAEESSTVDSAAIYSVVFSVDEIDAILGAGQFVDEDLKFNFAIYSVSDESLRFYRRESIPVVGATFEGRVVSSVYTGWDGGGWTIWSPDSWAEHQNSIRLVSVEDDGIAPLSTFSWFNNFKACTGITINRLDMRKVSNMSSMFSGCGVEVLDLSNMNTGHVQDRSSLFASCKNLKSVNFSGFDTSGATTFRAMFTDCGALTELNLSDFDTRNVTDMHSMFSFCGALEHVDISEFDTGRVTTMNSLFNTCASLQSMRFPESMDLASLCDMGYMFKSCTCLQEVDLSMFDTALVRYMQNMFCDCRALRTIYVSSAFVTRSVTNSSSMFFNCDVLHGGAGTKYTSVNQEKEYARIDNPPDAPGYFTLKS